MAELLVQIVTPAWYCFMTNGRASLLWFVRSIDGTIKVSLPGHTPIIVPLAIDSVPNLNVVSVDEENLIAVNGGIMEMRDNVCSIIGWISPKERWDIENVDVPFAAKASEQKRII